MKTEKSKDDGRITEKISRSVHEDLKKAHADYIGRTGAVLPFCKFCDMVIKAGISSLDSATP